MERCDWFDVEKADANDGIVEFCNDTNVTVIIDDSNLCAEHAEEYLLKPTTDWSKFQAKNSG